MGDVELGAVNTSSVDMLNDKLRPLCHEVADVALQRYPETVLVRVDNCVIYLRNQEDLALFNRVQAYREQHKADKNMYDAMEEFASEPGGDAIVKLVYRSRNVDYVLKYVDSKKDYNSVRIEWERKLISRGLFIEHDSDMYRRSVYVKVTAPFDLLCQQAEQLNLKLSLKKTEDNSAEQQVTKWQRFLDAIGYEPIAEPEPSAPLRVSKLHEFSGGEDRNPVAGDASPGLVKRLFFTKAHRNYLTHYLITHTLLSPADLRRIDNTHVKPSSSLGVSQMLNRNIYDKFFPLHDGSHKSKQDSPNSRTILMQQWAKAFFKPQPLDMVREYFGEQIALYYAYLGFYTTWLWSASALGIIVFIYGVANAFMTDAFASSIFTGASRVFDNALTIPFAAFVAIWATVYLEFWKRKQAFLAWRWDTMDYEEMETNRPEWYGTKVRVSPITGKREYHYPDTIRYMKMFASCTCIALAVLIVLVSVAGALTYRVWARNKFGICKLPGDQHLYGATCANMTSTPLSGADCTDRCYSLMTPSACASAGTQFTPSEPDAVLPSCSWNGNATVGWCEPACFAYADRMQCTFSYFDSSTVVGDPRQACVWTDELYISTITAAIINLFAIVVLNSLFEKVAVVLNDWENHKTETQYQDALILKTFFFQFLNSYTSLFYIAFFKGTVAKNIFGQPALRDECDYGSCFTELLIQLAIIFLGKQALNQFTEVMVPYFITRLKRTATQRRKAALEKKYHDVLQEAPASDLPVDPENDDKIPQWVKDETLSPVAGLLFDDYNEMALQFGFITLFVVAFPLGPFFALLNNITEIRTDAYKLITKYQRPPALPAEDIGTWYTILESIGLMCVITNGFIVAFSSAWVRDLLIENMMVPANIPAAEQDDRILSGRLAFVLLFEHVVIGLKLVIAYLIPDIPEPVRIAIDRENYLARLALDGFAGDQFEVEEDDMAENFLTRSVANAFGRMQANFAGSSTEEKNE